MPSRTITASAASSNTSSRDAGAPLAAPTSAVSLWVPSGPLKGPVSMAADVNRPDGRLSTV